MHGAPQQAVLGGRQVTLYPIYHPAAALYTPAMLKTLEEDFAKIPALLGGSGRPEPAVAPERGNVIQLPVAPTPAARADEQLGLF